ncbi:MAG: hypothetical protein WCS43_10170 [Verrucomicrobiota bacterium]
MIENPSGTVFHKKATICSMDGQGRPWQGANPASGGINIGITPSSRVANSASGSSTFHVPPNQRFRSAVPRNGSHNRDSQTNKAIATQRNSAKADINYQIVSLVLPTKMRFRKAPIATIPTTIGFQSLASRPDLESSLLAASCPALSCSRILFASSLSFSSSFSKRF